MNLVNEFIDVTKRIESIENHLSSDSEDKKVYEFLQSTLGQTDEKLELELEGLKITQAWLKDTLDYYVEEKGMPLDKNFKYYTGEDAEDNQ